MPGDGPLFTVVSRLTEQKGIDVLAECLDTLVALGGRLALLGAGDEALELALRQAAARHPGPGAWARGLHPSHAAVNRARARPLSFAARWPSPRRA